MRGRLWEIYREWARFNPWLRALVRIGVVIAVTGAGRGHLIGINVYYGVVSLVLVDIFVARPVGEGRTIEEAAFGRPRLLVPGFAIGAAMMSVIVAIFSIGGWYHVHGITHERNALNLFVGGVVLYFFVGVTEEVLMRGIVWRVFEERFGTAAALICSSLIFGFGHLGNPHSSVWAALAIAVEAGLLLGGLFLLTRTLWAPIGLHFAWNLFEGPVFGASVSGLHEHSILRAVFGGPTLWTGDGFGPEAGLVAVVVGTSVAIVLLVYARKTGKPIYPAKFQLRRSRPAVVEAPPV